MSTSPSGVPARNSEFIATASNSVLPTGRLRRVTASIPDRSMSSPAASRSARNMSSATATPSPWASTIACHRCAGVPSPASSTCDKGAPPSTSEASERPSMPLSPRSTSSSVRSWMRRAASRWAAVAVDPSARAPAAQSSTSASVTLCSRSPPNGVDASSSGQPPGTSSRWIGSRWMGRRWMGSRWIGESSTSSRWMGRRWIGSRWMGRRWMGRRWIGAFARAAA